MSEYTAERAEHRANHFENAGILDIAAMLRAYAATLRQQAERGDGAVSDEVVGAAWNAYEQSMSTRERFTQAYKRIAMRAALEAVAPLLRAPAVQGGRVDDERLHSDSAEDVAQWLYANGHHDAAATVRGQLDVRNVRIRELQAALAQNAQGNDRAVVLMSITDEVTPVLQPLEGWRDLPNGNYRLYTHADLQNAQGDEVARLKAVIERDRTAFCGLIARLNGELKSRAWLGDENARAAGGYTYDEPGFIREFGDACTAIMGALERAHRTFQDFTDRPSGEAIRNAQADAQAILDRHAERARVPDGWCSIKTAPKDGRVILAMLPESTVPHSVRYRDNAWHIVWDDHRLGNFDQPLKWMPIPAAAPSQPEDAA